MLPTTDERSTLDDRADETVRWCEALEADGYVRIPRAIEPDLLDHLRHDVASVHREELAAGRVDAGEPLHLLGSVTRRASFLELLDLAPAFDVVCQVLGWNIHLYHSHLDVHPPAAADSGPTWGWHQDGGRLNLDLETDPRPRISVKVAYWLSDVGEPGRGNTAVIPGSHLRNRLARPSEGGSSPPRGAVELLAEAGDAVVLDRRLWHSRTVNRSSVTRRALFLAYAPRWVRPRDDHGPERLAPDHPGLSPIRRQLLGETRGPMDAWGLADVPVPLREHLAAAGRLDATVPNHR